MENLPSGAPALLETSGGGWDRRLTLAELESAVSVADPAAVLILPRILRRVIKQDRGLAGFGLRVPHRKSYVIGRQPLLEIVDLAELGLADDAALPEKVLLLARPDPRKLAATPAGESLIRAWRLLFHARLHAALEDRMASGTLSPGSVRQRIQQIGTAKFEEICSVLGQEDLLLPPRSDQSVYVEFAAVYLELRHFAGGLLQRYFPGLENLELVDKMLAEDVDGEALFWATRPQGAPDPVDSQENQSTRSATAGTAAYGETMADVPSAAKPGAEVPPAGERSWITYPGAKRPSKLNYRLLMRKAQRPAGLGNTVRAAVYRARAARFAPPEFAGRAEAAMKADVCQLTARLQAALESDDADSQPWQESLWELANLAPRGIWTAEARLLYDLQKVCVDHEREIYTVDLVEWALSFGCRPIKRQLPNQRDVLMLRHLRTATRRLNVVRLSDSQRRQLALLIHKALDGVESRLRRQVRPQIAATLDQTGLIAQNVPESVARKKLVEELLDQIGERGFLTMGDLRDAISRKNLKLPDVSKASDLFRGDQLSRADRKLALVLDGVYRRAEFYMRWMQRLSSVAFGTRLGRLLTRVVAVPFGGAYVALAGVHHVWELIAGADQPQTHADSLGANGSSEIAADGFRLTSPPVVLLLGMFLLCLVNSAAFRRTVYLCLKASYRGFHAAVVEPLRWLIQSPWLQKIFHSRPFAYLVKFIIKPLIWTGAAWLLLPMERANRQTSALTAVSIFLAVNLLLNSRLGRNAEEVVADWIVQSWHKFGLRVITGLFWWCVDLFKWLLETFERLMYTVDEWLRFRSGQSRLWLLAAAGMGLLWFFVSYILRFAINVLIEPQINPIKHFPVVTVSHKLLLPLIPQFADVLELTLEKAWAWTVAGTVVTSAPGVFGFLVWELKENWRLYAANRRPNLSPVPIGLHGETMARLLKPGFHSGTLPKRFAKLRRAERQALAHGSWHSARKHLQAIGGIETAIRRYIEREFLELLSQSRCWQRPAVVLKEVRLGTNFVNLAIGCPGLAESELRVALEVEAGWLVAGIASPGWTDRLLPHQRQLLATALVGLYKSTGVDLVRQQIEAQFPQPAPWYGLSSQGLVIWPHGMEDVEILYALDDGPWIAPQSVRGLARRQLPTVERRQLVFAEIAVPWAAWVGVWNADGVGEVHLGHAIAPVRILP